MKTKLMSLVLVIVMLCSLSTTAFATSDFISDPDLQDSHTRNMELYDKYEAERNQLTAQFKANNPTVYYYNLLRTSWNANVFQHIAGGLYTGYKGAGYYCVSGYTTVYNGILSYTATVLGPDPNPNITAAYVKRYDELTALMNKYHDAAQSDIIQSIDEDGVKLRQITNWYTEEVDPNNEFQLIFQINNYMYSSGRANRTDFFWGMIEKGNRNAVPYVVNGNTMIPIRALIEGLGGKVDWDKELNGARATLKDISITMPIGSEYATVNGKSVKMTTPAVIANGKTMIPVRFVAENLGYDVEWVSEGQYVVIKNPNRMTIMGYSFDKPDGAYSDNYSYNNRNTLYYDVYIPGEYSEYDEYIDTVSIDIQLTTESEIDESHNFEYLTTTNGIMIYEEILPREEYNGDSYDRHLLCRNDENEIVMLVYAEYYVEDSDYDSSGFITDMNRAYGELKNDALDEFFDMIIDTVSPVWESV